MQHARSRQGCLTCRSKKVKCDEQTPNCRRCHRLQLKCDWPKPNGRLRPATKSRAKVKSDFPKILPRSVLRAADLRYDQYAMPIAWPLPIEISPTESHEVLLDQASNDLSVSAVLASDFAPVWGDWCHDLEFLGSPLPTDDSTAEAVTNNSTNGALHEAALCPSRNAHASMHVHWPSQPMDVMSLPSLGVSWQNMVLSQEFVQTGKESDALQYYTSLYPTMQSSKNVRWTSYMIMLRYSSQEPVAMHLLIAASLIDLTTAHDDNTDLCRAAQAHAKAGMYLLEAAMAPDADHDPVGVVIACFFLYRYMAVAQEFNAVMMAKWSDSVFNYVKRNRLENLCTGTGLAARDPLTTHNTALAAITHEKRSHLARLMIWIFYEDIFASIRGYGGSLARHLCAKPERAREIFQYSGGELKSSWGAEYPEREILDDVENAPILTFLYDTIPLYAEVNKVVDSSQSSDADKAAVEDKIEKLEERSRPLIRLTTITVQPRPRLMINADYMVPFFYALRIYCFRSFLTDDCLAIPSPPVIQSCVTSILQLAQRSLSRGLLDPMRARFQWPLFMAGIETKDTIHKEWVQSKMKTAKMSMAFQTVICLEEESQRRTPIALLRRILGGQNYTSTL